jgi:hypothetical protein
MWVHHQPFRFVSFFSAVAVTAVVPTPCGRPAQVEAPGRWQLVSLPGAVRGSATHAAMGLARWPPGPFGIDDRVELGPQQFLIGQQQLEELLHGAIAGRRATATSQVPCHHAPPGQALMACFSSPCWVISILRGLACSATGMVKVNTPAS